MIGDSPPASASADSAAAGISREALYGNAAVGAAQHAAPVVLYADPAQCSLELNLIGSLTRLSPCDLAKGYLASRMVSYVNQSLPAGSTPVIHVNQARIAAFEGTRLGKVALHEQEERSRKRSSGRSRRTATNGGRSAAREPGRAYRHPELSIVISRDDLHASIGTDDCAVPHAEPLHSDLAAIQYRRRLDRRLHVQRRLCDGGCQ